VSPRWSTARGAGTLDAQKATIERVSKEIGALADLVEANEAKGRMGQVCASKAQPMYSPGTMRRYSHTVLTRYPRGTRVPRCMSMLVLARHMRVSSHPEAAFVRQIAGAAKFRTASAEIADKIRRLVEVLQSGLQVREYPCYIGTRCGSARP
jgi:hypothetical protein